MLYGTPLLDERQRRFWEWVADYYMCTLGEVMRVALPSLTNEFITLVKDTALIYAVAVPDILKVAKDAMNRDFRISPLIMAGIVYLILNFIVEKAMGRLEKRYQFE